MIIIMEPEATTEQINKVVKHLEENDFKININITKKRLKYLKSLLKSINS